MIGAFGRIPLGLIGEGYCLFDEEFQGEAGSGSALALIECVLHDASSRRQRGERRICAANSRAGGGFPPS